MKGDQVTRSEDQSIFYIGYQRVIEEVLSEANVILRRDELNILDICMAPGGFATWILDHSDVASYCGFSLPYGLGGHNMQPGLVPFRTGTSARKGVDVRWLDITMLAGEHGLAHMAQLDHQPDQQGFSLDRPFIDKKFDLVLADGVVLEKHKRVEHREKGDEVIRLQCSEIAIALQRMKTGGTFIMLLHAVDAWRTVELLSDFASFAQVEVFKPSVRYKKNSSFYMIAREVQPATAEAQSCLVKVQERWRAATLRSAEDPKSPRETSLASTSDDDLVTDAINSLVIRDLGSSMSTVRREATDEEVHALLRSFGTKLIAMGEKPWRIQTEGLERVERLAKKAAGTVGQASQIPGTVVTPEKQQVLSGSWRRKGSVSEEITTQENVSHVVSSHIAPGKITGGRRDRVNQIQSSPWRGGHK